MSAVSCECLVGVTSSIHDPVFTSENWISRQILEYGDCIDLLVNSSLLQVMMRLEMFKKSDTKCASM